MKLLDFFLGREFSIKQHHKLMNNMFSKNLKYMQNNEYIHSIDLLSKMILKAEKMQSKLNENKPIQYTYENIQFDIVELYYLRGTSKMCTQNNKALDDFNTALSINPEHIESLYNRAVFYTNVKKDIKKAFTEISKALKLQPDNKDFIKFKEGLINLDKELSKKKETKKSIQYDFSDTLIFFNLAEEHFPNNKILLKSKRNFSKIYIKSDFKNLKKEFANREYEKLSGTQILNDPTQKNIEIKTFWKGSSYKGLPEGYFEVLREDGSLFMKVNELNNMTHGKRTIFDINGNIFEESLFVEGKWLGFKIQNNFEEEGFNRIEMYDDVESTGIIRGYYSDGEIYFEEEYLKGEKVGVWKEWYQNGNLKWERGYNVILDGVYNEYYENGNPKELGNFKQSMRIGDWKEYDSNGNLTMSEKWEPTDKNVSKCLERKCFNEKGVEIDCPELTNIRKTFTQQ